MSDGFSVDFQKLPPRLQMKLWVLALDANTSKVAIEYQAGIFKSSLSYDYGGNGHANLSIERLTLSGDTGGAFSAGYVFRGFNFQLTASPWKKSAGASLSYGADLLPMPTELASIFNHGGTGLASMALDIRRAPDNPLAWFKMHSDDKTAISAAIDAGSKIAKTKPGDAGFRIGLNHAPETGLTLSLATGVVF
jgi:hypothetical protein